MSELPLEVQLQLALDDLKVAEAKIESLEAEVLTLTDMLYYVSED